MFYNYNIIKMSYKQYLDAKKCCNLNSVGPQGPRQL